MATTDKPEFVITQGRIALALSLIALFGAFYQGTSFILDSRYRLSALEEKWAAIEKTQERFTVEASRLSTAINELNVTLREVQVRQGVK